MADLDLKNLTELQSIVSDLKTIANLMHNAVESETADDGEIDGGKKPARAKVMKFSIKTHNAEGKEVLTPELVVAISNKYKSIKRYALCLHDKDKYNSEDVLIYNKHHPEEPRQIGDAKDDHIHWVGEFGTNQPVSMIAKWFGVPENLIKVANGRGAFLDCVEYLTHEHENQQAKKKHRYDDDEVVANFDWREALNSRDEKKLKYGKADISIKEMLRYEVAYNGMTIKQVREQYRLEYLADCDKLKQLRRDYLKTRPSPTFKLNIYIGGIDGGIGKGLMGKSIVKSIIDPNDIMEDDEIWFKVKPDTKFNNYQGQPVLIWEDYRPVNLLEFFHHDRGALFKMIEPYPSQGDGLVDVKYDNTKLLNCINIFDCIVEPDEWLDALAGEYQKTDGTVVKSEAKQKSQVYRRFPITFWVLENDFSIRINKGVLEGTREYTQYVQSERFRGNLQVLRNSLNDAQYKQLSTKVTKPAVEIVQDVYDKLDSKHEDLTDEQLEELFGDWGKPVTEPQPPKQMTISDIERERNEKRQKELHDETVLNSVLVYHDLTVKQFIDIHEKVQTMTPEEIEDDRVNGDGLYWNVSKCNPMFIETARRVYEEKQARQKEKTERKNKH